MSIVKHRFLDHNINQLTEVLVIGTFNPDVIENNADFFYGRQRNFLWTLIPTSFGEESLKGKSKNEKLDFIKRYKIDFIDLISEVEVDELSNYKDAYLDDKVRLWRDVIDEISKLPCLKKICLTRKSFADIPNMKVKIEEISDYCKGHGLQFELLTTPARFYRQDKQEEWSRFFGCK